VIHTFLFRTKCGIDIDEVYNPPSQEVMSTYNPTNAPTNAMVASSSYNPSNPSNPSNAMAASSSSRYNLLDVSAHYAPQQYAQQYTPQAQQYADYATQEDYSQLFHTTHGIGVQYHDEDNSRVTVENENYLFPQEGENSGALWWPEQGNN